MVRDTMLKPPTNASLDSKSGQSKGGKKTLVEKIQCKGCGVEIENMEQTPAKDH